MSARELKLSIWTSLFWEFRPEDALRLVADCGWGYVDLSAEHLGELYRADSSRRVDDMRRLAEELDIIPYQTHGLMQTEPLLAGGRRFERFLDVVRGWLEISSRLGIRHHVLHPAFDARARRQDIVQANVRGFRALAREAERTGVKLAIENTAGDAYGAKPEELRGLIEAVGSPMLCVCFDSSHANYQGLEADDFLGRLRELVAVTHLSDNDGSGDQHRLPFDGTVRWYALVQAPADLGYEGTLNFEVPGPLRQASPPVAVRNAMLAYVEALMTELTRPAPGPAYQVRAEPLHEICKIAWTETYLGGEGV